MNYLSPTSVKLFTQDPELFYLRYLAKKRAPRDPQTQPMSIGSSFDAYAKSYLYEKVFGKGTDVRFDLETLFEAQVEEHNRDWAWENGKYVFEQYKKAGCIADLMVELNQAVGPPRFEITVQAEIEGVPLLGKPDVFFINKLGSRVIYDWKVNGYCAKSLKSPMAGYIKLREAGKTTKEHRDCVLLLYKGVYINAATYMTGDWADQLSIYAWLMGEPVGSEEVVFGIDQICGPKDRLRFATHRLRIRPDYQFHLLDLVKDTWEAIEQDHIFKDLSVEESQERGRLLEAEMEFEGLEREADWGECL